MRTTVRESPGDRAFLTGVYIFLSLVLLLMAYPIIYIVSSSISSANAIQSGLVWLWPVHLSILGYEAVFQDPQVLIGYLNSAFYTVFGTLLSVALTVLMAYPLSRRDLVGRQFVVWLLLFAFIFNGGLVPFYLVVKSLGLLDTRWSIILPSALGIYQILLAKTFFQSTIAPELFDAAQIDGCGNTGFLVRIVLPLSKPVLAVLALLFAVGQWNSYFNALIFLNSQELYPLQLVLRALLVLNENPLAQQSIDPEQLRRFQDMSTLLKYSLIVVASLPVLVLYPLAQRYFVKGVMIGSLKD